MKRLLAFTLILFTFGLVRSFAQQFKYPFQDPNLPAEKRIDNLLSLMTIDEKIDCLGTDTACRDSACPTIGGSEGIHGVVQREPRATVGSAHHDNPVSPAARHG